MTIKISKKVVKFSYLIFLLIVFFISQLTAFSQDDKSIFEKKADLINLLITKELLAESKKDTSQFSENDTFDEFYKKIPNDLKKNKEVANDIDKFKKDLSKDISFPKNYILLKIFIEKSKERIPKKDDPVRKLTLENLDKKFDRILKDVAEADNKIINQNLKDSFNSVKENVRKGEEFSGIIIYILVGISVINFGILVFLFFMLKIIPNKTFSLIKSNFEATKRNEDKNNAFWETKKFGEELSNFKNDNKELKNLLLEIKGLLKEKIENNKIEKGLNNFSPTIEKNLVKIKFAESPEQEGYFKRDFISDSEKYTSIYKILFYPDTNRIEFDLLENKVEMHRSAMNNCRTVLAPACNYSVEPSPNHKKIIKTNSEKGILVNEDDKLKIIKKLDVRFE